MKYIQRNMYSEYKVPCLDVVTSYRPALIRSLQNYSIDRLFILRIDEIVSVKISENFRRIAD